MDDLTRRAWLRQGAGLALAASLPGWATSPPAGDTFLDDLERRTFDFFWETTDARTGLAPDRWPTPSFASIAAVGFALTAYPIGVARGYISRAQARERTLTTLRFFAGLPQGPAARGVAGHKGFFYHFLDMKEGLRFDRCELSTVDTALLLMGALHAQSFFDGAEADEARIRALVDELYGRVDWAWAQVRPPSISHGWTPEAGFIASDWKGYNEAMMVYLLALGSPTRPVKPEAWAAWTSTYDRDSWGQSYGQTLLRFPPLFGHQFTHCWVDFRGIRDAWMREKSAEIGDFDYFQNSVRAAEAQQFYARTNPMGWAGYDAEVWGLTACDGPGDFTQTVDGREREFFSYSARGPGERDDGTIAPTAAMASMPFAPDAVTACLKAMKARYGEALYTQWGFLDSFNPTLTEREGPLMHGQIVPDIGWVNGDYLGIDQGPIVVMIENHRSNLVWNHMHGEPNLIRGLQRAGFEGGWLDRA